VIGRLLVAGALLLTLGATLGLTAWLELDRSQATTVYLPVQVSHANTSEIRLRLREPVAEALYERRDKDFELFPRVTDPPDVLVLDLDADGRVVGAERVDPPPPGAVYLQIRPDNAVAPLFAIPPIQDQDGIRWLRLRVTASGEAYHAGVTDEALELLGRGDPAW